MYAQGPLMVAVIFEKKNLLTEPIVKLRLSSLQQVSPFYNMRYDTAKWQSARLKPWLTQSVACHILAFVLAKKRTYIEKFGVILNLRICRLIPFPICQEPQVRHNTR